MVAYLGCITLAVIAGLESGLQSDCSLQAAGSKLTALKQDGKRAAGCLLAAIGITNLQIYFLCHCL